MCEIMNSDLELSRDLLLEYDAPYAIKVYTSKKDVISRFLGYLKDYTEKRVITRSLRETDKPMMYMDIDDLFEMIEALREMFPNYIFEPAFENGTERERDLYAKGPKVNCSYVDGNPYKEKDREGLYSHLDIEY